MEKNVFTETSKTVVILGMHRSGSSILGAILQVLGVDMGEDAYGSTAYNPTGHFEDKCIVDINNEILKAAGGSWASLPSKGMIASVVPEFSSKISTALAREDDIFGFKDPRTCITINAWLPHLTNPYFILCSRKQDSIAASLARRNGWSLEKGIELTQSYERHVQEFLADNPSIQKLEIRYEDLVKQPRSIIEKIAEFLQVRIDENKLQKAISLVVPRKNIEKQRYQHMFLKGIREPKKILPFLLKRFKVWMQRIRNITSSSSTLC